MAALDFGNAYEPGMYQHSAMSAYARAIPMSAGTYSRSIRSAASNCSAASLSALAVRFSSKYTTATVPGEGLGPAAQ